MNTSQRLTRSNTDRIIAGVAGGIANYLNVDPTLVRLGFVLLVFTGVPIWIYLVLWAVLPTESTVNQSFGQQVRENFAEMEQRATQVASQVSSQVNQIIGEQSRQVNQPTPPAGTNQQEQNQGPATGPTQRL
ncbi:MAG: PspC domain-containing protein [Chloroflexi bacterium]|nr:PspC domain-containing protein [Chloroflexota bacterium]